MAAMVNPTGPKLLLYPLGFIGGESATMRYIQEWQPPSFREPMGLAFGLSVILLVVLGLRRPRFDYTLGLWAVAFTYLGFSAMRHVPLYALVVIPIIAQQLPDALARPGVAVSRESLHRDDQLGLDRAGPGDDGRDRLRQPAGPDPPRAEPESVPDRVIGLSARQSAAASCSMRTASVAT